MVIKAVIFDCFGVLVMTRLNAITNEFPQIKEAYAKIGQSADLGKLSHFEFIKIVASLVGMTEVEVENTYWTSNKINNEMIDFVAELKSTQKYKVGLLSNVNRDSMDEYLHLFDERKLFDDEVISSDVGLAKPNPEIFKLAAQRLNLQTNECVMIDDVMRNVESAKSVGMQAIQYVSNDQIKADLNKLLGAMNA